MVLIEEVSNSGIDMQTVNVDELIEKMVGNNLDPETTNGLRKGLKKYYQDPPVPQMRKVLGMDTLPASFSSSCDIDQDLQAARKILFFPETEDMRYFCEAISFHAPPSLGVDSKERENVEGEEESPVSEKEKQKQEGENEMRMKVRIPCLALLYIKHIKSFDLAKSFVLKGGLASLVSLFEYENLYLRSQAMDVFLQISGLEEFDWFDALVQEQKGISEEDRSLMLAEMEKLLSETNIISSLIANWYDSFPGGHLYSLQLFGFYASWIRLKYNQSRMAMSCNEVIVNALKDCADKIEKELESSAETPQDKRENVAKTMLEDFSKFTFADSSSTNGKVENGKRTVYFRFEYIKEEEPHEPTADDMKKKGNAHLKSGELKEAIEAYTKGIELDSKNTACLCNRSLAYLKLCESGDPGQSNAVDDESSLQHSTFLRRALNDSLRALKYDRLYTKASFRAAKAFFLSKEIMKASAFCRNSLELAKKEGSSTTEIDKLMAEINEKLIEVELSLINDSITNSDE
eukprot:Nk52_evm82s212 gene=Nk52_evmTU82s212